MRGFLVSLLFLSCLATVFGYEDEALRTGGALPLSHHGGYYPPVEAPAPSHHHNHHHHPHPPTLPPVHPPPPKPTHLPPTHPPTHYPPAHAPSHPPPHYPPAHAPSHPPPHPPPVHPPSHPPAHPPSSLPPRKLVAVQGVVYCKSCKYRGIDTLLGASPLLGATVKLQCNNTKYPLEVKGKTDKNGYFFIEAPKKITTYGAHKCKVFLVSSPSLTCNIPTDLHLGLWGAILRPEKLPAGHTPPPYAVYSVGPFAFEPAKKVECPR